MEGNFKEISFINTNTSKFQFDCVDLEDIFSRKPTDHSQFDFHKLSFYFILLFTGDTGNYNLNFKEYSFKKGTLFTVRKGSVHKFYRNNGKGILFVFTEDFIIKHTNEIEASKTFLLFNELLASPKIQLDKQQYQEIIQLVDLIKQEYFEKGDEFALNIIRNLIQVFVDKLFRIKSKNNANLESHKYLSMFLEFQKLVEAHCRQQKKVVFYAKTMGVTTKTLSNVTQRMVQKTAKSFINDIVIIQSKRLIINSQDSITQIAYQLGFEEPTNFFKFFRKHVGMSPNEFRAQ